MTLLTGVLIIGLILLGSVAQRMAGLGFAMLVSPFMVLVLGAHSGVVLVNALSIMSSALILPRVWRSIDWSLFRWLGGFAVVGSLVGAWLSQLFSAAVLAVAVGGIVIVALGGSLAVRGGRFSTEQRTPRALAGLLSGVTSALAGVGGPAVSAYAVLTRWPQASFAATLQPYFLLISATATAAKLVLDPAALPATPWWFWVIVLAVLVGGITLGERLLTVVSSRQVRRFVIVLAFVGAAATLVRGLWELFG